MAGFDLPDPVRPPDLTDRRYGLSNLSEAARFGYGLPDEAIPSDRVQMKELSESERKALGSDGDQEGCIGIGTARVTGSALAATATSPVAVKIQKDTWLASSEDGRVRASISDWSKCMKSGGFEMSTPLESPKAGISESEEKRIATSSIKCSSSVGLPRVWFDVEAELQVLAISKESAKLEAEKGELRRQLDKADSIAKMAGGLDGGN
ncbi:hypothetical protein [Streptomyces sp. NPDC096351]|uniref:hypothetical protein n=1 Tax=Streptomyces sp. NPDC096351 TaxID=3366087 RepID=UPI003804C6A3